MQKRDSCLKKGLNKSNVFIIYAKVFKLLLSKWIQLTSASKEKDLEKLVLPSDESWRYKVYYSLVELQRQLSSKLKKKKSIDFDAESKKTLKWEWEPRLEANLPKFRKNANENFTEKSPNSEDQHFSCEEPKWRLGDILLAAKVLEKQSPAPNYKDEAEMRRVFSLVYDVLRCKEILYRTLENVNFMKEFKKLKSKEKVVWLLLYDMQERKFEHFGTIAMMEARRKAFLQAGLQDIEESLLKMKTKIAASLSRLRINGSALKLDDLLPLHLRTTTNNGESMIATGWVNTMKFSNKEEFVGEMAKLGLKLSWETVVDENFYIFDPLCPKVVNFHEKVRETLAVSKLVRDFRFIFLDRSQCLGAAILGHTIRNNHLCGPVVLTHSVTPRHVGYLVNLLVDIEDAGRLLVFGAGDKKSEYEIYLHQLGITLQQCCIFSQKYSSSPSFPELERATIILAAPPSSYTGVSDVVDLAIARNGDVELLELLANSNSLTRQPRTLLDDQLTTLKHALTMPNVQLLIYEMHTFLSCETTEIIEHIVQHANIMATEKYIRQQTEKKKTLSKEVEKKRGKKETDENIDESSEEIKIPDRNLFELTCVSNLYPENFSNDLLSKGCYMAMVRRKEMMQFNSIFMIKVAESKGLFGDTEKQGRLKTEQLLNVVKQTSSTDRKIIKRSKFRMEHIMLHTHSSLSRIRREIRTCLRHSRHIAHDENVINYQIRKARSYDARRWWADSTICLQMARKFRKLKTDPRTQKFLLPANVLRIAFGKRNGRVSAIIA